MRVTGRRVVILVAAVLVVAGGVVGGLVATSGTSGFPAADSYARGPLAANAGPFLTDSQGRVVFLRGVNAVYKRAPFELYADPGTPWNFTAADAQRMAKLGFNVVRLGLIWEGLEPGTAPPNDPAICSAGTPRNPHQFNAAVAAAYLAKVAKTVELLGRYHIYTLLDMHEDVYSSEFGGEGAPPWAVCTDGEPIGTLPGRWSNTYNDPALRTAVQHFWANDVAGDLQGEYDRVWQTVARYFSHDPWIAGYDPINEPFTRDLTATSAPPGSPLVAGHLECFYTGTAHPGLRFFDGTPLTCPPDDPSKGLIRTIQDADPHHLVFFEPDIFSSRGKRNDVGPMNLKGLVFNFHVYCGLRSGVTGDPTDLDGCAAQELRTMRRRSEERPDIASAKQPAGPAWFMSEFGATTSEPLMVRLTANADQLELGWTYWAWKYYGDPTGSSDEALVTATGALAPTAASISRVYPEAVAGTPISFAFDPASADFHLVYAPKAQVDAPTVVVVPVAVHYPEGYCAQVTGGTIVSKPDSTHLLIANTPNASIVAVTVKPRTCQGSGV
ncbi:MAG: cellulase family glycosylhydrolase [Acidimicrobiales bacterium]